MIAYFGNSEPGRRSSGCFSSNFNLPFVNTVSPNLVNGLAYLVVQLDKHIMFKNRNELLLTYIDFLNAGVSLFIMKEWVSVLCLLRFYLFLRERERERESGWACVGEWVLLRDKEMVFVENRWEWEHLTALNREKERERGGDCLLDKVKFIGHYPSTASTSRLQMSETSLTTFSWISLARQLFPPARVL